MTMEEYQFYSNITIRLFSYMNNRINKLNRDCTLQIEMYDFVNKTYGHIRHPNSVVIFVGSIINDWHEEWSDFVNKIDYVGTCIALAIAHELHHADQRLLMLKYKANQEYNNKIEEDANRAAYDWVSNNKDSLSLVGGFNIIISSLKIMCVPEKANYRSATVKEFYLQTIENIIIRDRNLYNQIKSYLLDNNLDSIIINFNNLESIRIKENKRFIRQNITAFSSLSYKYAGAFDTYGIAVKATQFVSLKNNDVISLQVDFTISNPLIQGLVT